MDSQYGPLKEIAAALRTIAGKNNTSDKEVAALNAIAQKIERGNVINIEGAAGGSADTSQLNNSLKAALMYSVTQGETVVTKGLAQLVAELTTVMTDVKKALDGTTQSGVSARLSTIGTNTGNIHTDTDSIATHLNTIKGHTSTMATNSANWGSGGGSGGGGSVDLTTIEGHLSDISDSLSGELAAGVSARLKILADKILQGDANISAAVMRKLATPQASLIIEGLVNSSSMLFTSASGQPSFAQAYSAYISGQLVMLKYNIGQQRVVHDMVTYGADGNGINLLKTQNGYHFTSDGTAQSVVVAGTVDNYGQFTPQSVNYGDALVYFQNGIPLYLSAGGSVRPVTSYNRTYDMLIADGNTRWFWSGS